MEETGSACIILMGKPLAKHLLGRPTLCEGDIKIAIKEVRCKDGRRMNWLRAMSKGTSLVSLLFHPQVLLPESWLVE
jgi:hypothetical protein